ncbi:MAG: 2-amino-4-hydroxy-6-hydroxymethyldihydropteridinepyrophosphokinase [Candidatus Celerinatantimonas neptuna]|nr:MAG: 2-amino-4-hydroxy-6-hydroxymethyldihydropteridinepyrophosphokinase [Candidatus Celerinatantimonas neptuna]
MIRCYIGLGSNLANPRQQLHQAVLAFKQMTHCQLVAISSLYGSKPMGPQDQPDYMNAVLALDTTLTAESLLDATQQIELEQGRVRKKLRWGPRTLDLDLLLFGNQTIETSRLTVPHYGLEQREFVVLPLAEIAPQLILPNGHEIAGLAKTIQINQIKRLEPASEWTANSVTERL